MADEEVVIADCDFEMESIEGGRCIAPTDAEETSGTNSLLCIFCDKMPKKKGQWYCSVCEPDIRGAIRDAERQGPAAKKALSLLRRRGGPPLIQAVAVYKAKCASVGRGAARPAFAWVQYWMAVSSPSVRSMSQTALF